MPTWTRSESELVMKIGDSVRMVFRPARNPHYDSVMGVVRALSPRRIIVWTGTTGFGQKRWPFDQKGRPVGRTFDVYPDLEIDLSYVDLFKGASP